MNDRQISAACTVAYGLWAAALGLWLTSYIAHDGGLGQLAILVMGAAATATVRSYFIDLGRRFKTALALSRATQPPEVRPIR